MVIMLPTRGKRKPAPTLARTSRMGRMKPLGAPEGRARGGGRGGRAGGQAGLQAKRGRGWGWPGGCWDGAVGARAAERERQAVQDRWARVLEARGSWTSGHGQLHCRRGVSHKGTRRRRSACRMQGFAASMQQLHTCVSADVLAGGRAPVAFWLAAAPTCHWVGQLCSPPPSRLPPTLRPQSDGILRRRLQSCVTAGRPTPPDPTPTHPPPPAV